MKEAYYVFGCVDIDGARLVLNELCSAYSTPYFEIASDADPGPPLAYGGRVCVSWDKMDAWSALVFSIPTSPNVI